MSQTPRKEYTPQARGGGVLEGISELIDIVDRGKVTEEQKKAVAVSLAAR